MAKPDRVQLARKFLDYYSEDVLEASRRSNPLTRVKVKSPSMATKQAPSKRLVARRKSTQKAPAGYYANPVKGASESGFIVLLVEASGKAHYMQRWPTKQKATIEAQKFSDITKKKFAVVSAGDYQKLLRGVIL
jgi:hypothetical protein